MSWKSRADLAQLNRPLIGVPGGRWRIETPTLVVDLDGLEANMVRLSALAERHGVSVRPHAKAHKSGRIARLQSDAGAIGICCAKTSEALALYDEGIRTLMITAPVSSRAKIELLAAAAADGADLTVVVDTEELVDSFAEAAAAFQASITVLVDCDTGLGRTGVKSSSRAVDLARRIVSRDLLSYGGVQAYAGHVQAIADHRARQLAIDEVNGRLAAILTALREAGLSPRIVSGGGTGSAFIDAAGGLYTEIQPGSYLFMDEAYSKVDVDGRGGSHFQSTLYVATTIIGHNAAGAAITDAGSKAFGIDGPAPTAFLEGRTIGRIAWAGDEFGRLDLFDGEALPPVGTRLECSPPHCDTTVNQHAYFHLARGDRLVDIWPIDARGMSA